MEKPKIIPLKGRDVSSLFALVNNELNSIITYVEFDVSQDR
jgi:hypothetical protein